MKNWTHKELIPIACRWVLKFGSCGCAFKELVTVTGEIADVIGFGSSNHSVLVEVKVSRSDFLCDKKKPFRIDPDKGIGLRRFYCCPDNLIKVTELPSGWGLIYVSDKGKACVVHNPYNSFIQIPPTVERDKRWSGFVRNEFAERALMYSALRRLQLKGFIENIYDGKYQK